MSDEPRLSHLDEHGAARMVPVGGKPVTQRRATAAGQVTMQPATLAAIVDQAAPKGDVLATARIAGIQAAKRTSELIPLCHSLPLDAVSVEFEAVAGDPARMLVRATAACTGRTGVEMEALTAVSVACLTLYDMLKAIDRGMVIGEIRLLEKTGGKSDWRRAEK